MINIPPRHFVVIENPHQRDENKNPIEDAIGQVKLRHADTEIRLSGDWPEPFPLYPGEKQLGGLQKLVVVDKNSALRLRAVRDCKDVEGADRKAGETWLFLGPATYTPTVQVEVEETIRATIIKQNCALKLRAMRDLVDCTGAKRQAGEEWLVRQVGAYLPQAQEQIIATVQAHTLTERTALHLCASTTFTDIFGAVRKAGSEWLVTVEDAETHIQDVHEQVIGTVHITTLNNRQWCVVQHPYDNNGVIRMGAKKLVQGEASFFLRPGELIPDGIQEIYVLAEDEALLLQALETFVDQSDGKKVNHEAGCRWMVYGPCEFVPPVEVNVLEKRKAMPLDENEGVYVRDLKTGQVRAVIGTTYMLKPDEELWSKPLSPDVEMLLEAQAGGNIYITPAHHGGKTLPKMSGTKRDKTRVISFRVPHNAAVQIYDYKANQMRVIFGPDLALLQPNEQLTVLKLSGDSPKRENVHTTLCLMLGPDFMTDAIQVETSDHARLQLQLAYNWHFKRDLITRRTATRIFNVPDFVGAATKAMASRIRGAVAGETFDNFHKNSAEVIRTAVFGAKGATEWVFTSNGLCITNVDIQGVEPVDDRTRESLQKSVQLAIEITTASQEARARHEAKREEEQAKGLLEQQTIKNQASSEDARRQLLELQAQSAEIEAKGCAIAEAQATAQAASIEGEAAVEQAQLRAQAMSIEASASLHQRKAEQEVEIAHQAELIKLEVEKARELAGIESNKFQQTVDAIGPDTICQIAQAGPEMQAKLLQGLGLKGFLVTDGTNPVNLFNTAQGFVGGNNVGNEGTMNLSGNANPGMLNMMSS